MEDANLQVLDRVGESKRGSEQLYEVKLLCCGRVTQMSAQAILRRAKDKRKTCAVCSNMKRGVEERNFEPPPVQDLGLSADTIVINGFVFPVLQPPGIGSRSRARANRSGVKSLWER
jgi:hypothetical protein